MAEEQQAEKAGKKSAGSSLRLIESLLAGIGLFAGLCYFLGRLRTIAYYNALGISPNTLSFSPEDYMFSSFSLVLMCGFASYGLYEYYRLYRRGKRRLLLSTVFREPRSRIERVVNLSVVIAIALFAAMVLVGLYLGIWGGGTPFPGFIGISVGFALATAIILWLRLLEYLFGKSHSLAIIIIGVVMVISALPLVTTKMANIEAKVDMQQFPTAVLICNDVLDPHLQSSPQNPRESIEIGVITSNNGVLYVLRQDDKSVDEWQIYGLQEDDITTIIYLKSAD